MKSLDLNAGLHPVSEPETKAVADFLFDRFNIYAVFTFGPQDNLGQPLKSSERADDSFILQKQSGGNGTRTENRIRETEELLPL